MARIITLPGDGIGPEVLASALEVLRAVADDLEYEEHPFGGASIDAHGTPLTDETLAACQGADAVLLAAVGGPKWDSTDPGKARPEQGLLAIRKGPLRRGAIRGTGSLAVSSAQYKDLLEQLLHEDWCDAVLSVIGRSQGYYKVRLRTGETGWVTSDHVGCCR